MRLRLAIAALTLGLTTAALWSGAAPAHQEAHQGGSADYKVEVAPERVAQGQAAFHQLCARCHQDPVGRSVHHAPDLTGLYEREKTPAMGHPVTDANIRDHIQKGGGKMPAFPQITGEAMRDLIAYLRTL